MEDLVMVPARSDADRATNAVLARRRLAQGLRRYRQRAGLTIEDLARGLECSAAKVSRMETGISGIRIQDLTAITHLIDFAESERRDLEELVRRARGREWWQEFTDVVPPGSGTFFGLEDGAATIEIHATSLIPGLLQTADYARALVGSVNGVAPELLARRVALRQRRQRLLDRPDAPRLTVLMDEAVLRRTIGDGPLMAAQWEHVLRCAESAGVVVQIIRSDAPIHPAEGVGFTLFSFEDQDLSPVVFAEALGQQTFVDEPDPVRVYVDALASAQRVAQAPDISLEMMSKRVNELRTGG
jgi:transcriptional regulator with XRE-family HTH domain